MKREQKHDEWYFTGAGPTYGTFNNTAAADVDSANPPFTTDLTDTTHGLLADSLLYIEGTVNYNGLRLIKSVPDVNSMVIFAKFIAETLGGTETWKVKFGYENLVDNVPVPHTAFELIGFEITLDAAAATASELLTITVDAARGSAWDNLIYSQDMNGIADINYMFEAPTQCTAGDKIDIAWANADANTWGIKLFTRAVI